MNKQQRNKWLKFAISFLFAALLIFYLYKDEKPADLIDFMSQADYKWVLGSAFISLLSHISRAVRWKIMLAQIGYKVRAHTSTYAVLIGYFTNMLLPRAGEFARCSSLQNTDQVPFNKSLGAVLAERVIDLIMLVSLLLFTFIIEYEKVGALISSSFTLLQEKLVSLAWYVWLSGLVIFTIGGVLFYLWWQRSKKASNGIQAKLRQFIAGLGQGFASVGKLKKAALVWFVIHSLLIWLLYYLMTWLLFFSYQESADAGLRCALAVFVMGGIGMVLPSPGGTGTFHWFAISTLVLYGFEDKFARLFAFFLHSMQVIVQLFFGAISFVLILTTVKKVN